MGQRDVKHVSTQPGGSEPLHGKIVPQQLNLVRGTSVDATKTHRIDQIFTVIGDELIFGVPRSSAEITEEISTDTGKSLDPGVIVPGLICRVKFSKDGFANARFENSYLENIHRMTPEEFGHDLAAGVHPSFLELEKALKIFHRDRVAEIFPWILSDPYEAVMGEPRQPKDFIADESRGNSFVADLSLLIHHLAGKYFQEHNVEALFLGRTVTILSEDENRIKVKSYDDFLGYAKDLVAPTEINLSVSPLFWTTKAMVNMGEGGGFTGGIVAPCTAPLRSLTARINVRILSMLAAGIVPSDPTGELKVVAAIRNAEMRERRGGEHTARAIRLSLVEGKNGVQAISQVPSLPGATDTFQAKKELKRYHEQCTDVARILLRSRPHAAHLAFAIKSFDRSRKDWDSSVRHATLLWLKEHPEFFPPIAELLRLTTTEGLNEERAKSRILLLLQASPQYLEGLPFLARGYHFSNMPDMYASQEQEFASALHKIFTKFHLPIAKPGFRYELSRAKTVVDEFGKRRVYGNSARAILKLDRYTYTSEWCAGRTLSAAQNKAAASMLRLLGRRRILPWEIIRNPDQLKAGVRIVPTHARIGSLESNSDNWDTLRTWKPLMTTFDVVMLKKGWTFDCYEDISNGKAGHVMLKVYTKEGEFLTVEPLRGNLTAKTRDIMRRTLRYLIAAQLLDPSDIFTTDMSVHGTLLFDDAKKEYQLSINGIFQPVTLQGPTDHLAIGKQYNARLVYSEAESRYYAKIPGTSRRRADQKS